MNTSQPGGSAPKRRHSLPRFLAVSLLAATVLLCNTLPDAARSQISGHAIKPPFTKSVAARPALPKAPKQVELPAPPPMRIVPGMEEVLVATGPVTAEESKALDAALREFHDAPLKAGPQADYDDYAKPLLAFIVAHPKSNWNAALNLNIGLGYYHAGYYSRAFTYFEKAWRLGRDATSMPAHLIADRAVGELAEMHARVGHGEELDALFKDIGDRPIGGPATELLKNARYGRMSFEHNPGISFLCGPRALKNVLIALNASKKQIDVADKARSGPRGFTLSELAALAGKAKLKYTLIHREPGQPVPVPSVINWNLHHYAAVVSEHDGVYHVMDPTFAAISSGSTALRLKAIDAESSGYFLVPASVMAANPKAGWRVVSAKSAEAKAVYGMGLAGASLGGVTLCVDCMIHEVSQWIQGIGTHLMASRYSRAPQMTIANAHTMLNNLNLSDTPVGYETQVGLPALTRINYNAQETFLPATFSFSNLSPKWSHSWMDHITDDPHTGQEGYNVARHAAGGGGYAYIFNYNHTTGCLPREITDESLICRTPVSGTATSYTRTLPDGTVEVFSKSDGATSYPRRIFLTSVTDPQGNTTTLNYDTSLRITSVVDAMGRSTTFTYGLSAHPLLITQITDPFGRTSQFTYDSSLRLASITDPAGITSSYTYSTTELTFVTKLTTPYGTTMFNDTRNPHDSPNMQVNSLTITDPLGHTDFLYFYQNGSVIPSTDPSALVPVGMASTDNGYLEWRNTYYWNPHAFALYCTMNSSGTPQSEDFTKALIYHWYHDEVTFYTGRQLGSIKPPLEHRTWFNYPSQTSPWYGGYFTSSTYRGLVLDDGSTQLSTDTYNAYGLPLTHTDPLGRATKYTYDTNNIDLLTVQQLTTSPSTYSTIATYGSYNSQHLPATYTGPDGQTWNYTYTTLGQLKTVTDPNSGVTTYNYDTSNRLSTIVNANSQTVATYTYDSADRVQTFTDSEGYVLTYAYDNLDRVTSITYPDGTTDLYDYNFQSGPYVGTASLELRKHTDRLGRVTTWDYDAARRLTSVTEPTLGSGTRTTQYAYWEDGTLKDIIDANGNDTHWEIDIESRPTSKTYAYGTASAQTETYAYESSTSRLKSVTDALGQVKTFTYDKNNQVTGITYTSSVNTTPNVTFAYDTYFPRLTSMTDGLGTTSYGYTAIGSNGALKLSSIDGPYSNDVIGLTYDALGRLSGRTITGGNETFGYDAISRMTSHGTPLGSFTYTYLGETGQTASRSVTNGSITVSTAWGYDTNTNDRRLISITNSGTTRSYTLGYGSGPVNVYDIMSITDTAASGHPWATQSRSYTYDNIDRLLTESVTAPGNSTFAYDKLDNATTWNTPASGSLSPTFNVLNQLATFGALTYSYDADGNTLSGDGVKTYKWDAENRLIEIDYVGTSNKSVFSYDGMGHRTLDAETVSGVTTTTRYLWCGAFICQTRDGSDTVLRRDLSEGEYNVSTSQKLVYMPDQLGSVRDVLDATTGNLVQSYDFTPYGAVARSNGSTPTDYQYAGLFAHPQSGLNFATYRVQDGVTGRWLNRDPIREASGPNVYAYVEANITNYFDPLGLANWNLFKNGTNLSIWENLWNPPGVFSIAGHGVLPMGINNGNAPGGFGEGPTLTGDEFIDQLYANGYKRNSGMTVVVHACNAGKGGANSFAQWLADRINAPVIAPDNFLLIGVNANGTEYNKVMNGGHFWLFTPGKPPQMLGSSAY